MSMTRELVARAELLLRVDVELAAHRLFAGHSGPEDLLDGAADERAREIVAAALVAVGSPMTAMGPYIGLYRGPARSAVIECP
jgi:hypothetical protein